MRVTSKGQVTIPKAIRDRAGIWPGKEVEFAVEGEVVVIRPAGNRQGGRDAFESYLDEVTGTMELGMSTDEFMELLRGE